MTAGIHPTRVSLMTAARPGAVAILQLHGGDVVGVLKRVTGRDAWQPGQIALVDIAAIDHGLAVWLPGGSGDVVQLMPHGGPRVVQLILEKLAELGVCVDREPGTLAWYPEADSPIEADALHTVAHAASPAAIDRLLAQTRLWRKALRGDRPIDCEKVLRDSAVLDRLIAPPTVVVAGRPNVGKSTLTNRLLGRTVSLVADLPGTTRDWVGAMVELGGISDAVAVRWLDTPGLRDSSDRIEQRAIDMARRIIQQADVLIAMRDPEQDWPEQASLLREPDLRVVNKVDEVNAETAWPGAITISGKTGRGIDVLQRHIIDTLGLNTVEADTLWAFSGRLRDFVRGDINDLDAYLGQVRPPAC